MPEPSNTTPLEKTVVIVGVGLIGGSLAAALKHRKLAHRVIGVGRDAGRIESARIAGLIDDAVTDVASVVEAADLIVFCTPVDRIVADVKTAQEALSKVAARSSRESNVIFTDVGSVKESICVHLADVPNFIGSHPIAGSHRKGFEAADAELFDRRICVLTPLPSTNQSQLDRLDRFWQGVGMQTVRMTPRKHDESLAMTSHLPHVAASALANTLSNDNRFLTGSGFRDTTRVAAGDPGLWTSILLGNATHVMHGIEDFQKQLSEFHRALEARDLDRIQELLSLGQQSRVNLDKSQQGFDQNLLE